MSKNLFFIFVVFLGSLAGSARAEIVGLSVLPSPATSADVIRARLDIQGCDSAAGTAIVNAEMRRIDVRISVSDVCDTSNPANYLTPRFINVGVLDPGAYSVRFLACASIPPPLDPCELIQTQTLLIGAPQPLPAVVPTLNRWGLLLLALALGGVAIHQRKNG